MKFSIIIPLKHINSYIRENLKNILLQSYNNYEVIILPNFNNPNGIKFSKNVRVIPDGAGTFTEGMGMTVDMSAIGFGKRSRRYAAVVNNGTVEHMFVEPESSADNPDPYGVSSPENVISHL